MGLVYRARIGQLVQRLADPRSSQVLSNQLEVAFTRSVMNRFNALDTAEIQRVA